MAGRHDEYSTIRLRRLYILFGHIGPLPGRQLEALSEHD